MNKLSRSTLNSEWAIKEASNMIWEAEHTYDMKRRRRLICDAELMLQYADRYDKSEIPELDPE